MENQEVSIISSKTRERLFIRFECFYRRFRDASDIFKLYGYGDRGVKIGTVKTYCYELFNDEIKGLEGFFYDGFNDEHSYDLGISRLKNSLKQEKFNQFLEDVAENAVQYFINIFKEFGYLDEELLLEVKQKTTNSEKFVILYYYFENKKIRAKLEKTLDEILSDEFKEKIVKVLGVFEGNKYPKAYNEILRAVRSIIGSEFD